MICTRSELGPLAAEWDRLAAAEGNLFLTSAWLTSWWGAFGSGEPTWLLAFGSERSLRGGAFMCLRAGKLASATNVHSGAWDGLACDEQARAELWAAVAELGANRVHAQGLSARAGRAQALCAQLQRTGYRVASVRGARSPWLALPSSWEDLLASVSSGLRAQVRRRRRMLEREGALQFRTTTGGPTLEGDLESFLRLEASGWKGKSKTAILSKPSTERLYRSFAHAAAEDGLLRLNLLELDGTLIAGSYDCAYAGVGSLLKTAFSGAHSRLSPGLVLLSEVLRASIEEGLQGYDFLGEDDLYKTRWGSELRARVDIFAYRRAALPGYLYRKRLRPLLKSARDRAIGLKDAVPLRRGKARHRSRDG